MLWKEDIIKLDQVAVTQQEIHSIVQVQPKPHTWLFSVIYAKNDMQSRHVLWENLRQLHDTIKLHWLLGDDFNEVTKA